MNEHPAGRDPWVVRIGRDYHFGPIEGREAAYELAEQHGGQAWPLFGLHEDDVLDGEPWIAQAKKAAAK